MRLALWSGLGAAALLGCDRRAWLLSLPPAPAVKAAKHEADATIAALKPPKRQRQLIAIIGINNATETTDYLMPYGILRRADVADVMTLPATPRPPSCGSTRNRTSESGHVVSMRLRLPTFCLSPHTCRP